MRAHTRDDTERYDAWCIASRFSSSWLFQSYNSKKVAAVTAPDQSKSSNTTAKPNKGSHMRTKIVRVEIGRDRCLLAPQTHGMFCMSSWAGWVEMELGEKHVRRRVNPLFTGCLNVVHFSEPSLVFLKRTNRSYLSASCWDFVLPPPAQREHSVPPRALVG